MRYLILSCSLHPRSLSRFLAGRLRESLPVDETDFVDLADLNLPLCDGSSAYGHAEVAPIRERIAAADGIVVATPVYNYAVSASAKNLVELTGREWSGKVVGLLCASAGRNSYMAAMPFLNSLMLDFRCFVLPRFVYAPGLVYEENLTLDDELERRIRELGSELIRVTGALSASKAPGRK